MPAPTEKLSARKLPSLFLLSQILRGFFCIACGSHVQELSDNKAIMPVSQWT